MLFSVYAENQANIIEHEKKRQAEFGMRGPLTALVGCDFVAALRVELPGLRNCGVKPPETKALTGQRTPKVLLDNGGEFFEIIDEAAMFEASGFIIRSSQY